MTKNMNDDTHTAACSVEALEAELSEAIAKRDALRDELAGVSRFLDRARESTGAEIWKIDLQKGMIGFGMGSCSFALEEQFHPDDLRTLLKKVAGLRRDQPEIQIELRLPGCREKRGRFRFCGRAETFDADDRPVLLVGVMVNIFNQIQENSPLLQKQLWELLDSSFAIFYWLDISGSGYVYASPAAKEYFLPSEGQTYEGMMKKGLESLHPDDRQEIEAYIGRVLSKKSDHPVTNAFTYRRRNFRGEYHWFYDVMTFMPDRDGIFQTMLGSAIDITAQKGTESTLQIAEQRYSQLTRLSCAVIWSAGLDMHFDYCSPSIFDLLGYTPEEVIALGSEVTLLPESYGTVAGLIEDALTKEAREPGVVIPFRFEIWQRHKSGRAVLTDVAASMVRDDSGRLIGFCGATLDITESHRMKEILKKSREELQNNVLVRTEELARANENLRQEIERRRQVESALIRMSETEQRSIGHELHDGLCQQLAGVMCLCQAARERLLEIGSIDAIQMGRIHDLLGAAVRYSRYMSRGLSPLFADAEGLCSSLEALAVSSTAMFNVTCRFSRSGSCRVQDSEQALSLYRIAREAIQNAIQHGKAGRIDILLKTSSRRVCLIVSDDGCGRTAPLSAAPEYGLSMIDYRMRAMEGSVRMKNLRGGGMAVRCIAPLSRQTKGGGNAPIE